MEKLIKEWKKVLESDLGYIVNELKEEFQVPALIFLEGSLGAGKTTLCQYFCGKQMLSPTYSILSDWHNVLHADFYRIEKSEEITFLELSLYLEGKDYFFAEWGMRWMDQIVKQLPDHYSYYKLQLTQVEGSEATQRHLKLYSINPLL